MQTLCNCIAFAKFQNRNSLNTNLLSFSLQNSHFLITYNFYTVFLLKKGLCYAKNHICIAFALHLHCFCLIFRNNTKFPQDIDYPTFAHVAFSSVRTLPFSFSSSSTFASSFPTLINNSWINKSFSFTVAAE